MTASFTGVYRSITASFEGRPPLVLIVDDEATIRLMTRRFLEHADFMVVDAASGEAAQKQIQRIEPDVILLDVDMPGMDGYELTRWIRSQPKTRYTPIVMITGREDPESVNAAYEVGATDFIVKPIAWPVLSHRVRYILRGSETQLALRDSHARVKAIVEALPDRLFSLDESGRVIGDNNSLLSFEASSSSGTTTSLRTGAWSAYEHAFRQEIERVTSNIIGSVLRDDELDETAISLMDDNNKMRHYEVRVVKQSEKNGLAVVRDVTEQKEAVSKIHQLAYYDSLTGLPNRQFFSSELRACMERCKESQEQFALLYVDLDHFKRINDTLGHTTGDELLKMVADRLQRCLRATDVLALRDDNEAYMEGNIARLGGDEFTLIIHGAESVDNIENVANRIIDTLKVPFEFSGHEFVVTPSIGIAIYPSDGEDEETLLKTADVAMYQAKQAGRSGYSFCTETTSVRSLERLDLELDLRRAIEAKQFELHYQPKVNASNWQLIGVEALLRWRHPTRGWISPARIVPIAEDTGLIVPIGRWIISEACRQMAAWQAEGLRAVPISVNLSSQQFWQDDIASVVEAALGTYDIPADMLELELTEGVLMRDVKQTRDALQLLKQTGVSLAVDDFGTGYSSLAYLRQFPLDALKIDRSFVDDLPQEDAAAICNAIISMAQSLNLMVVAEGVENRAQLDYLTQQQCDQIQGYFFSKPLAASALEQVLRDSDFFSRIVSESGAQSVSPANVAASASAM
ncbi:MAG: EAL domain-containing protein [Pseudomonadota bacterium]